MICPIISSNLVLDMQYLPQPTHASIIRGAVVAGERGYQAVGAWGHCMQNTLVNKNKHTHSSSVSYTQGGATKCTNKVGRKSHLHLLHPARLLRK